MRARLVAFANDLRTTFESLAVRFVSSDDGSGTGGGGGGGLEQLRKRAIKTMVVVIR